MASLSGLTVAELDALAEEHNVADYPADENKAEKVAALEAAGVSEPCEKHRVRLTDAVREKLAGEDVREDLRFVAFMQTLRIASSSVAPISIDIGAPCVLALLGFRSAKQHRTSRRDH